MCSDDDDARTLQGDEFGPGADAFSMEEDVAATPTPPTPTPSESGDRRHSSTETLEQQETEDEEEEMTPRGSAANLILQPEDQNPQQQPHHQSNEQVNT